MLALLSIRMAVRMGRSILKPSSDSSPPPSWIQSRAKTVAAAACSSAPPGDNRKIVFVCQWLQLLLAVFQKQELQHLREEKNVRIFLWMYIICTCVLNESMGLTVEFLFHLAFLKTPFQAVADGEASLRQEVVQHFGGKGLSQRLKTCKTRLSTGRERKREFKFFFGQHHFMP